MDRPVYHTDEMDELLTPSEVDAVLRYRSGRAKRLARMGKIPFVRLPDGEIRFKQQDIERIVCGKGEDHA